MIINTNVFSSDLFRFDKKTKEISTDAAELEHAASQGELYTRIYDDAYDVGFWIFNPKTGKKTLWYVHSHFAEFGDDRLWDTLYPVDKSLDGWTVTVFND